ncbi:MAG: glycosyltransferase [Elusimicrobiota bacterium]|jgi:glycosyltransferase involved in cell wall biosynthesis
MRILFLLSCLEPAGSETYCLSLAEAWQGKHEVFWISDRLHYGQTYTSWPIHQKAFPAGVLNTWRVARFIRRHQIQLIHSHSRRSHWVAAQAAALTGIPHVTTIHQPPPVHLFSRAFPCFGDAALAIDEAVVDHLTQRFHYPLKQIHLIRNGVDLNRFQPAANPGSAVKQLLLLGRLSGGRWKAFEFFLEVLRSIAFSLPPTVFRIAGKVPEDRAAAFVEQLRVVNTAVAPSRVESIGFIQDLPAFLHDVDMVIAGGRSALESLASAKPVIIMGEGGVLGICGPETWPQALRTNFGDHLVPKTFAPETLALALRDLLLAPERAEELGRWGRGQVEKYYDIRKTAEAVDAVYQSLIRT